ncbi:hypothetical protein DFH11DRAFT_1787243 [Phellopilus nigrolimitatus]|nr:hypothetical protein DFH11DRAFT_1787243 [Phellopilus nigrolimitatus]
MVVGSASRAPSRRPSSVVSAARNENASPFRKNGLAPSYQQRFQRRRRDRLRAQKNGRTSAAVSSSPSQELQGNDEAASGASPQAAAHAAAWEMGGADPQSATPAFTSVTLPRQLRRPPFREPSRAALAVVDPALADTNIEFVKDCLEMNGAEMFAVLVHTTVLSAHKPRGPRSLPTHARIRVADARSDLPTHMLAAYAPQPASGAGAGAGGARAAQLSPVHAVQLAVYCTALRTLPASEPAAQLAAVAAAAAAEVTVPVVPLEVPAPRLLPMLVAVLYTQRHDNFLRALLGVPLLPPPPPPGTELQHGLPTPTHSPSGPAASLPHLPTQTTLFSQPFFSNRAPDAAEAEAEASPAALAQSIAGTSAALVALYARDARALLARVQLVGGVAADARALGVCDAGVWGTLDVAWAVLLGALGVCAGAPP